MESAEQFWRGLAAKMEAELRTRGVVTTWPYDLGVVGIPAIRERDRAVAAEAREKMAQIAEGFKRIDSEIIGERPNKTRRGEIVADALARTIAAAIRAAGGGKA